MKKVIEKQFAEFKAPETYGKNFFNKYFSWLPWVDDGEKDNDGNQKDPKLPFDWDKQK